MKLDLDELERLATEGEDEATLALVAIARAAQSVESAHRKVLSFPAIVGHASWEEMSVLGPAIDEREAALRALGAALRAAGLLGEGS